MKEKLIKNLLLVLTMSVLCFAVGVSASAETSADGFTYTIYDGEVTITGYEGTSVDLIIPEEVEGYSVTKIGSFAFENRSDLTGELFIPESVINIERSAFSGCSGFVGDLIIPNGITNIGEFAFSNCYGFTGDLIIPNSVTIIEACAFNGCYGFTGNLVIPDSVIYIGETAFADCYGFTGDLIIPDSVTNIKACTFCNCYGFTGNLIIPDSVTNIEYLAFINCYGFTGGLIIPDSVTGIGDSAFGNCYGFTGDLIIPDSVISIGNYAFSNCYGFTGCLIISDSVISIGDYAFGDCHNLTGDLIIPKDVTSIGSRAFNLCASLNRIVVNSDNNNYSSDENGVLFNKNKSVLLQYPLGSREISYSVPNGVIRIADGAFADSANYRGYNNLCEIYIPLSVVQFGFNISGIGGFSHIGYEGNKAQWDAIFKEEYNEHMSNVHYNFIGEKDFKVQTTTVSCITDGLTRRTCSCGYNYALDYVAAYGHDIGEFITVKESNCSEKGEKRAYCSKCDYYETKKTALKKHNNTNNDEYCDVCELYLPSLDCLCVCHAKTIGAFVYKLFTILDKFFGTKLLEKVFDISEYCVCGLKH